MPAGSPIRNFTGSWNGAVDRMVIATKATEYKGLLFHDLRRSAVRNMVQKAKIPEVLAMKISGHQTHSMLTRYNIVAREDVAAAGRELDDWMKRQRPSKARRK